MTFFIQAVVISAAVLWYTRTRPHLPSTSRWRFDTVMIISVLLFVGAFVSSIL